MDTETLKCVRAIFSSAATVRVKTPIIIQQSGGEQRVLEKLDEEKRAGHKIRQFISNLFWLYQVHTTAPACRMNQDNMRKCLSSSQHTTRKSATIRLSLLSPVISSFLPNNKFQLYNWGVATNRFRKRRTESGIFK